MGKAYSGLTDAEIAEMSAWMMEHTLEDQGFFSTVEPLMVLEVAFNNIMRSGRHASGFALRFPRILRIRTDKPVSEIDTVERVEEIYQSQVDKPVEAVRSMDLERRQRLRHQSQHGISTAGQVGVEGAGALLWCGDVGHEGRVL